MTKIVEQFSSSKRGDSRLGLDGKLAAYLAAAGAVGTYLASEAEAVIVGSNAVVPFGINSETNFDFNGDGQIDLQLDHDRVNLAGNDLDYLQIDKNDVTSETMPLPTDAPAYFSTFPTGATVQNNPWTAGYLTNVQGAYPSALGEDSVIGPSKFFDFQEGDNYAGSFQYIRVNRLLDEDAGQIDAANGQTPYTPLPGSPNFVGLGGAVRYLGVKVGLNTGNPLSNNLNVNYGWIGIQITNEADATGNVVGWAYETELNTPIRAGNIPEPSSMLMAIVGGAFMVVGLLKRGLFGRRRS